MRAYDVVYLGALLAALASAGIELFVSRRNERRLRQEGFREVAPWVFRAMVPVYLLAFVAGPIERFGPPVREEPWLLLLPLVAALAAAKALKAWVIATLRGSWTKKVFVRAGMPIRTDGPFAFITGACIGSAFGLLLVARIWTEEQGLEGVGPYRELMGLKTSRGR
jgi:methyltransferase